MTIPTEVVEAAARSLPGVAFNEVAWAGKMAEARRVLESAMEAGWWYVPREDAITFEGRLRRIDEFCTQCLGGGRNNAIERIRAMARGMVVDPDFAAERDRYAEALRDIADCDWIDGSEGRPQEIAREALGARAKV